jgi:hypothetical protein
VQEVRWLVAMVVAVVAVAPATAPTAGAGEPPGDGPIPCPRLSGVAVEGTVEEPRLTELSGVIGSEEHYETLWAVNDSGGAAELYAMGEDGTALGAYPVEGATNVDWEDLAVGRFPDPARSYVFIGDIGDNEATRESVTVYRVPEPVLPLEPPGRPLPDAVAIELRYPGGPADAEALLVDPRTGDLIIITKAQGFERTSRVLRAPAASLVEGAPVTMLDDGEFTVPILDFIPNRPLWAVTSADFGFDGAALLVRTYASIYVYLRADGVSVADALRNMPCVAPSAREDQGEAIAVLDGIDGYVTISEGAAAKIHHVAVLEDSGPTTTELPRNPFLPIAEEASPTATGLVVAIVIATGLAVVLWARRPVPQLSGLSVRPRRRAASGTNGSGANGP